MNTRLRMHCLSAVRITVNTLHLSTVRITVNTLHHRPVLVSGAMKGWGAMKWTRKMLVEKYGEELMALAMTKGGLSKREVYVMPVKELDLQVANRLS